MKFSGILYTGNNWTGICTFGASSISQLDSAYIQNIKNASQYINSIEKNNLAVLRGYSVTNEQKIIREIINSIIVIILWI